MGTEVEDYLTLAGLCVYAQQSKLYPSKGTFKENLSSNVYAKLSVIKTRGTKRKNMHSIKVCDSICQDKEPCYRTLETKLFLFSSIKGSPMAGEIAGKSACWSRKGRYFDSSIHMVAHNFCNSSSKGPEVFWPL